MAPYKILAPHRVSDRYLLANPGFSGTRLGRCQQRHPLAHDAGGRPAALHQVGRAEQRGAPGWCGCGGVPDPILRLAADLKRDGQPDAPPHVAEIANPRGEVAKFMKWPVLEERSVVVRGRKTRAFRVCLVGYEDSGKEPAPHRPARGRGQRTEGGFEGNSARPPAPWPRRSEPRPHRADGHDEFDAAGAQPVPARTSSGSSRSSFAPTPASSCGSVGGAYQDKLKSGRQHYVAKFFGSFDVSDPKQLHTLRHRIATRPC